MSVLTGRYKLEPTKWGGIAFFVEHHDDRGFHWRKAKAADLKNEKIEMAASDGWRFPEERYGMLYVDERGTGRRDKCHKDQCGCMSFP